LEIDLEMKIANGSGESGREMGGEEGRGGESCVLETNNKAGDWIENGKNDLTRRRKWRPILDAQSQTHKSMAIGHQSYSQSIWLPYKIALEILSAL
jgi:hypothetical protein